MAWSYYSRNMHLDSVINVDMLAALRALEKLTGKPLVHIADCNGNRKETNVLPPSVHDIISELKERIETLERKVSLLEAKLAVYEKQ